MSLAGEAAAQVRRAASASDECSVRIGPSEWSFGGLLDFEFSDNVLFESKDPQWDLISRPQANIRTVWRLSERNSVNLGMGIGYSAYARHSEFNRLFIVPGSELSLNLYIADFVIDLHERLSITKDAYADPTVVGLANYSQLQNAAGLSATWDLNKVVVRVGYDHANYEVLAGQGGPPSGDSDTFALSVGYRGKAPTIFGIETGGGWIRYSQGTAPFDSGVDCNFGGFVEVQPSPYVSIRGGAGYTIYNGSSSVGPSTEATFTGVYARLTMNHRLNRHLEYDLTAGRSINFAFYAGTIDMYALDLLAQWHLFQKLSLGTGVGFEHGSAILSGGETFDRFGPRVILQRPITDKMSGALRYQYYYRESDISGGDYAVNLVTVSLSYQL